MTNIIILIIAVGLLIELFYSPRIEKTRLNDYLLFFGPPGNRKWIHIFLILICLNINSFGQNASYYATKFNNKVSASGIIFHNNNYVCAHRTLPFGTKIKVTNIKNNKSIIVTVIDRGPFIKKRVIDLSQRAFKSIASLKSGFITVKIEIL